MQPMSGTKQSQLIPGKIIKVKQHGYTPAGKKKRLEKDYRNFIFYPNLTTPTNNRKELRPTFPRSVRRIAALELRKQMKRDHKVALQEEHDRKFIANVEVKD